MEMRIIKKSILLALFLAASGLTHAYAISMSDDSVNLSKQKHGMISDSAKCSRSFVMILKATDSSIVCVKSSTAKVLIQRGWAQDNSMKIGNNIHQNDDMTNHDMKMNKSSMKESMNKTTEQNSTLAEKSMSADNDMAMSSVDESKYRDAPALTGISDYINTTPAKLAQDMGGKVIVYDFWTFNCINCIHTLPHVVDLSNKYLGKALVIGVHSPETIVEKDPANVRDAVHKYNIQYPVVLDSDFQTWNAFGNHYWPHVYIVDSHGKIRADYIGEGSYDEIDKTVGDLILEQDKQNPKELLMG
jgi:thiol-disulfide isomerase/thioredoxin